MKHIKSAGYCSLLFCSLAAIGPIHAAQDNPASSEVATQESITEPSTPENQVQPEATSALVFGVDLYHGLSNIEGYRRYDDHMWAGYGPFVPSTVYARYENERGYSAKLAIGTGDQFNTDDDEFYQPAEATISGPLSRNTRFTLGKFWVPFGLQEWEYESKPGAMLEWGRGEYGLALAATRNQSLGTGNYYGRLSKNWGEEATVGVSLAAGRGITFDSDHNRGIGLDARYNWRNFEATSELLRFTRDSSGALDFVWGRLAYKGWDKWTPYVSRYLWKDDLRQQGSFRSTVLGVQRQLTKALSVETAYGRVGGENKVWAELHYNWEWPVGRIR